MIALRLSILCVLGLLAGGCGDQPSKEPTPPAYAASVSDPTSGSSVNVTLDPAETDVAGRLTLRATANWPDGSSVEWMDPAIAAQNEPAAAPTPSIELISQSDLTYESGRFSQTRTFVVVPELPGVFRVERVGVRVDSPGSSRRICRAPDVPIEVVSSLDDPTSLALEPSEGFAAMETAETGPTRVVVIVAGAAAFVALTMLVILGRRSGSTDNLSTTPLEVLDDIASRKELSDNDLSKALGTLRGTDGVNTAIDELVALLEHARYSGGTTEPERIRSCARRALESLQPGSLRGGAA